MNANSDSKGLWTTCLLKSGTRSGSYRTNENHDVPEGGWLTWLLQLNKVLRNSGAFKMIVSWNTIYNTLFIIAQVFIAYMNSARIRDTLY